MQERESAAVKGHLWRAVFLLAAVTPFGLSLIAHAGGSTARRPVETVRRPSLAFNQYMVNLGMVPVGEKYIRARFRFTNTGDLPIRIGKLVASCQCINPQLRNGKRVYQPGERGEFYVFVETTKEPPGLREYVIKVPYEDSETREVDLTFKVTLPQPQVIVRPKSLGFYQLNGNPTTHEIMVIDTRQPPLKVLSVKSTTKLAKAKIAHVESEPGNHRVIISITVDGNVPATRMTGTIRIETDDPVFGNLSVPILIQGPKSAASKTAASAKLQDRQLR